MSAPHTMTILERLLPLAHEHEASDLHIVAGVPPAFRVNGEIILSEGDVLSEVNVDEMAVQLLNEAQRAKFDQDWELCVSMRHPSAGRVRVTFYKRNGHAE